MNQIFKCLNQGEKCQIRQKMTKTKLKITLEQT